MISFYAADGATCNLRGPAASARVEEEIVCHLHSYTDKGTGTVVVPVHIWIGTVIDTDAEPKARECRCLFSVVGGYDGEDKG